MAKKSTTKAPETVEAAPEQDQITLTGYLVRTPVLRHTETSGRAVTNLTLGVEDGEETSYHRVVCWNKTAEAVCNFLKAGRKVTVVGREQTREYKPEDGEARQITEISARTVEFLPRERKAETQENEVAA